MRMSQDEIEREAKKITKKHKKKCSQEERPSQSVASAASSLHQVSIDLKDHYPNVIIFIKMTYNVNK